MSYSKSSGFLYYDTSGPNDNSGANESSDFLEFNNDNNQSSPRKNFSPGYCSSPTSYNQGPRRSRGGNKFHGISGRGRYSRNNDSSFGENRKFGSNSFEDCRDSPGFRNRLDRRSYNKSGFDEDFHDPANYINPSMVQDPWKELEDKLMQQIQIRNSEKL